MHLLYDLMIIVLLIGLGFTLKFFKLSTSMISGLTTAGYLMSIVLFAFFDGAGKTLIDLLLVFKPIIYSVLMIRFTESLKKPKVDIQKLLTQRERDIAVLILEGKSNKEIAEVFVISEMTVKKHVQNILRKAKCKNRLEFIDLLKSE